METGEPGECVEGCEAAATIVACGCRFLPDLHPIDVSVGVSNEL